jgi:predicted glycosyltransferase
LTHYEKLGREYLLENMYFDDYDFPIPENDIAKFYVIYLTFLTEYGYNIKRYGEYKAIEEWLMGLPSIISLPYTWYDITEYFKKIGLITTKTSEREIEKKLQNYWSYCANSLLKGFKETKLKKNEKLILEYKKKLEQYKK